MAGQEEAAHQGGALTQILYHGLQCGVHTVDEAGITQVGFKVLLCRCRSLGRKRLRVWFLLGNAVAYHDVQFWDCLEAAHAVAQFVRLLFVVCRSWVLCHVSSGGNANTRNCINLTMVLCRSCVDWSTCGAS